MKVPSLRDRAQKIKDLAEGKKAAKQINRSDDDNRFARAREIALDFRKYLYTELKENTLKTKPPKSGFTQLIQQNRSKYPLYYMGALYQGRKKLPTLSELRNATNTKFDIGKYIYILFTGLGFQVGFYLDATYTEPSGVAPFNRNRKGRPFFIKDLLHVLEHGSKKIPVSAKMLRFYFAVIRYYGAKPKFAVDEKGNRIPRGKKHVWRIPPRPFWKKFIRRFKANYSRDVNVSITETTGVPYSVYITVAADKQPVGITKPKIERKKKL